MKNNTPVKPLRRATFISGAHTMVVIEVTTGDIEIYRVDPSDKIEMFLGYVNDLRIPGRIKSRAVAALYSDTAEVFDTFQLALPEAA